MVSPSWTMIELTRWRSLMVGELIVELVVAATSLTSWSMSSAIMPFALMRGVTCRIAPVLRYSMLFTWTRALRPRTVQGFRA